MEGRLLETLGWPLCLVTGYDAVSLRSNSGGHDGCG
jgi:hypothetical protein